MTKFLFFIIFISGISGLSYELIYTRIISYYFGDLYLTIFTVLTSVFLGLALGYKYSYKWVKQLWVIEAMLGVYAFLMAFVFHFLGVDVLAYIPSFLLGSKTVLSSLVIFTPMFLVGFSIPILSIYASQGNTNSEEKSSTVFPYVYGLYTIGSALALILLELFFLEDWGITTVLIASGLLNMFVAVYLYFTKKTFVPEKDPSPKEKTVHPLPFFLGILSMMFQYFFIETSFRIFGPSISSFTFVLSSALCGVAFGSFLTTVTNFKWHSFLTIFLYLGLFPFLIFSYVIYWWADLSTYLKSTYLINLELIKILFIFFMSIGMFTLFGAIVPLFLKWNKKASVQRVLFSNSLGNALGIPLAGIILYSIFDLRLTLILIVCSILFISYGVINKIYTFFALFSIMSLVLFWPSRELYVGSSRLVSQTATEIKQYVKGMKNIQHIRYLGNETTLYETDRYYGREGRLMVFHNGYRTLALKKRKGIVKHESFLPAISAWYSQKHNNALVLGLGTGVTVSTTADAYKNVKVFEINPGTFEMIQILKDYNDNISNKKNIDVVLQDAFIGTYLEKNESYDAIISSTSPLYYYSSSKLYSKDFLQIVKNKLTKGGVFVTWYSSEISIHKTNILHNTLNSVFKTCKSFIIKASYHIVLCGERLTLNERYNFSHIKNNIVKKVFSHAPYLEATLDKNLLKKNHWQGEVNTLNKLITKSPYFSVDDPRKRYHVYNKEVLHMVHSSPYPRKKLCAAMKFFSFKIFRNHSSLSPCLSLKQ